MHRPNWLRAGGCQPFAIGGPPLADKQTYLGPPKIVCPVADQKSRTLPLVCFAAFLFPAPWVENGTSGPACRIFHKRHSRVVAAVHKELAILLNLPANAFNVSPRSRSVASLSNRIGRTRRGYLLRN
jgi:hypothetical protein